MNVEKGSSHELQDTAEQGGAGAFPCPKCGSESVAPIRAGMSWDDRKCVKCGARFSSAATLIGRALLADPSAAQRAIPEEGYGWPDGQLKELGEKVKRLYPELDAWGPHLAAEGYLHFVSHSDIEPAPDARDPGDQRNAAFISFLLSLLARTPGVRSC